MKEDEEMRKIIKNNQNEHISTLPEAQQEKNKSYPKIKQQDDLPYFRCGWIIIE